MQKGFGVCQNCDSLLALLYQGKDIVFRFIIEYYSS
jgi:hypothetical protein